ncbi:hypothetical protein AALB47_16050 [Lachnospiraceae bacterium 54-11]|mgnify:FL=1|jgi:hypothetical protein|nr:hypothetical protein [Lachnospiraceae bacterium]
MKFVKRISLFFIYPLTMFAAGFASNIAIMEFFYPGEQILRISEEENSELLPETEEESEDTEPVAMIEEPVFSANTRYVVQDYDVFSGETVEAEEMAPDKFMGLSRDRLAAEIGEYNSNPSLTDLEQGFTFMELVSFSPDRVVVRKSYERIDTEKGFFLLNENHYVVVYDYSLSHVYMNTDILVESLPEKLQEEILNMKFVENEKGLYNFLESYSS